MINNEHQQALMRALGFDAAELKENQAGRLSARQALRVRHWLRPGSSWHISGRLAVLIVGLGLVLMAALLFFGLQAGEFFKVLNAAPILWVFMAFMLLGVLTLVWMITRIARRPVKVTDTSIPGSLFVVSGEVLAPGDQATTSGGRQLPVIFVSGTPLFVFESIEAGLFEPGQLYDAYYVAAENGDHYLVSVTPSALT